jgi:sugar lactone lactonase YvrE
LTPTQIRVAVAEPALLGESPMWHPHEQALYYCDIPGRQLRRYRPHSGELQVWPFESEVASLAPRLGGGLILALRDGLWHFDPDTAERHKVAVAPYDTATERFNDGKCDPQGRFWVGTIYEPRDAPRAALYCYAQTTLSRRMGSLTVSNGLAWSPDGRTMLWSDTKAYTIYAADFDPANATLSHQRVFASFLAPPTDAPLSSYGGRPDGAAMDTEGCYWVAMFEGQRLLRLSPTGEVLHELALPVRCPTMPCFGGADLRTLYITSARHKRSTQELQAQPLAGCVLAVDVTVPGLPVNFFT